MVAAQLKCSLKYNLVLGILHKVLGVIKSFLSLSMSEFPFPLQENKDQQSVIDFHFEEVSITAFQAEVYVLWIKKTILHHQCKLGQLQYIFCTDEYLHRMNVAYLNHDTLTDIITFPYQEPPIVSGDIFISIDRVKENASERNLPFGDELSRVIIHGILHLCGYGDKNEAEAAEMRRMENEALFVLRPES